MKAPASLMSVALFLIPGCVVHDHGHRHAHYGVEVTVPVVHVHDARCGHYLYRGRWYYRHGHVHGPNCGHAFIDGHWLFLD